jgi:hypothetical protein
MGRDQRSGVFPSDVVVFPSLMEFLLAAEIPLSPDKASWLQAAASFAYKPSSCPVGRPALTNLPCRELAANRSLRVYPPLEGFGTVAKPLVVFLLSGNFREITTPELSRFPSWSPRGDLDARSELFLRPFSFGNV